MIPPTASNRSLRLRTDGTPVDLIAMIKHLRCLTKFLGKLDVTCLRRENQMWVDQQIWNKQNPGKEGRVFDRYHYGWGLKESKDFVEIYLDRKT